MSAAVEAELGFDPHVNSADITVMNIGGDVNLTGTVPSYPQYLEAAAAARRPPVRLDSRPRPRPNR
jgi:osmotically-inducible protein OsmY